MSKSEYVYTTYIKTTPQKLWKALTNREFMRQYWGGAHIETDWKAGSVWKLLNDDGKLFDTGEVLEVKPFRRLVLKWRNEWNPKFNAEGFSRCVMDIEPVQKAVKLTVTHTINKPKSGLIKAVSGGWPFILSNLKSLLETGNIVVRKNCK